MAESAELLRLKAQSQTVMCNCCLLQVSQVRLFTCDCKHVMCAGCAKTWKAQNPGRKLKCPHCNETTEESKGILHIGLVRCQDCEELTKSKFIVCCKECQMIVCLACDQPSQQRHGLKGHAVESWNTLKPIKEGLARLSKELSDAENAKEHNAKVLAATLKRVEKGLRQHLSLGSSGLQDVLQTVGALYDCNASEEDSSGSNVDGYLKLFTAALHLANVNTNPLEFQPPPLLQSPSEENVQKLVEQFIEFLTTISTDNSNAERSTASSASTALTPGPLPAELPTVQPVPQNPATRPDLPILQVSYTPKYTVNTLIAGTHYDRCVLSRSPLVLLSADNKALSVSLKNDGTTEVKEEGRLGINSDSLQIAGVLGGGKFMSVAFSQDEIVVHIPDTFRKYNFDVGERRIKTKGPITECHVTKYFYGPHRVVAVNHHDGSSTICHIDLTNRGNDVQEIFRTRIGPVEYQYNYEFCYYDHESHSIVIREFDSETKVSRTIATVDTLPCRDLESLVFGYCNGSYHIVGKSGDYIVAVERKDRENVGAARVAVLPEQFKDASLIRSYPDFYLAQKNGHELRFHKFTLP